MKKMIASALVLLTLSTSAFAFAPRIDFYINREVGVFHIWNNQPRPVVCNGQLFGITFNGVTLNAWVRNLVVYPGVYVEGYVHSNPMDPMYQTWAQVDCQFTW